MITRSYCFNLPIWKETDAEHKATKSRCGFQEASEKPKTVWQLGFPFWFMTTHKWFLFNGLESSLSFKRPISGASAIAQVLGLFGFPCVVDVYGFRVSGSRSYFSQRHLHFFGNTPSPTISPCVSGGVAFTNVCWAWYHSDGVWVVGAHEMQPWEFLVIPLWRRLLCVELCPPPPNSYVEVLTPSASECDLFGA